ncbi:MAG: hypothetical protein LBT25_03360 [Candidatus Symbiothrix sp.]|jgi:hypothetical protein|nr:hypothetical protein [Candidatus Symbiothrix sp.]
MKNISDWLAQGWWMGLSVIVTIIMVVVPKWWMRVAIIIAIVVTIIAVVVPEWWMFVAIIIIAIFVVYIIINWRKWNWKWKMGIIVIVIIGAIVFIVIKFCCGNDLIYKGIVCDAETKNIIAGTKLTFQDINEQTDSTGAFSVLLEKEYPNEKITITKEGYHTKEFDRNLTKEFIKKQDTICLSADIQPDTLINKPARIPPPPNNYIYVSCEEENIDNINQGRLKDAVEALLSENGYILPNNRSRACFCLHIKAKARCNVNEYGQAFAYMDVTAELTKCDSTVITKAIFPDVNDGGELTCEKALRKAIDKAVPMIWNEIESKLKEK